MGGVTQWQDINMSLLSVQPGDVLSFYRKYGRSTDLSTLRVTPNPCITAPTQGQTDSNATLTLKNTTEQTILFKIKTTAPRRYIVRPNSGRISPNETVEVAGKH